MKSVSIQFEKQNWRDWHGIQQPVPTVIRTIARTFADLQVDRHTADYNNHEPWTLTEVEDILEATRSAFRDWNAISTDPMAGNYLLAMLLGKQRA